ncbi:acetate uptake transporter [Methanosphaerula palustris]|nr:acetate uptake transporter [Methanosphaerula palustris]
MMGYLDDTSRNNLFINDNSANPAPLGLCAFGMTTLLLSFHNVGITALTSTIFAMALLYGGLAQVIVGTMEWRKSNTFGLLTFGSFGFFWITFATLLILPTLGLAKAPGPIEMALFLGVWDILAIGLFICSLKMDKVLQITLLALVVTFILLMAAQITASSTILTLGGAVGIITGALALYLGLGQVINEVYGRKVVPV